MFIFLNIIIIKLILLKIKRDVKNSTRDIMENERKYGSFYDYLSHNGFLFDKKIIENYLLSLKVKPFVILTGNSGTGKTRLSNLFAEYLMENNPKNQEINISFEEDDKGYITFKDKNSYLSHHFALGDATIRFLLGQYNHHYIMDFYVEGIKITRPIFIKYSVKSSDKELLKHLKSINTSDIEIKICKKDLSDTFINQQSIEVNTISFDRLIKEILHYFFPSSELEHVLKIKKDSSWNAIVDGKKTTFNFSIDNISFTLDSENKDLKNIIEKKGMGNNLNIEVDLSSLRESNEDFLYDDEIEGEVYIVSKDGDGNIGKDNSIHSNNLIIPVGANWTENRHIVGFHNVITNEYQSTPARDFILQSEDNKSEPHFLILDEMNLSHVERYFADFLSALESGKAIPIPSKEVEDLVIPPNLFIIGTVNVDETTYMFSPKVLDRANVIEFETYPSDKYMSGEFDKDVPSKNIKFLENPLDSYRIREYKINHLKNFFSDVKVGNEKFWQILSDEIYAFQQILKESGFDFGFRVINEIVRFMAVAYVYEGGEGEFTEWKRYFDACIKQKLLPKLHGSEKVIGPTLYNLYDKCVKKEGNKVVKEYYPESAHKLEEMIKVLKNQRYVSFIN